jgi:hypothetical protein
VFNIRHAETKVQERTFQRTAIAASLIFLSIIAMSCAHAATAGLPPGQHTATPKLWSEGPWRVTNYSPLEFNYRIDSLTPGTDHDLWFSIGSSIDHIDAQRTMTAIRMPEPQWIVSGITIANRQVWFSAGQSGKVGLVGSDGQPSFFQAVPRRDFPDLRDIFVNSAGDMWFVDAGRSSIGYRSASGRVVENPFNITPETVVESQYGTRVYPERMAHCMGKFWVAARDSMRSELYVIDENLRPQPYFVNRPAHTEVYDIACDSADRLWLDLVDYRTGSTVERFDKGGHFKTIFLSGFAGGELTPDQSGGVWLTGLFNRGPLQSLIHIDRQSAITKRTLPTTPAYGQWPIADASDGTLWLGVTYGNSPIAVTELEPLPPAAAVMRQ